MIFNSLSFWAFFVLVFALYLVLPHRGQNRMLLIASYVFYGFWDWRFLSLIAFTTTVDYFVSHQVYATNDNSLKKRWVTVSLFANLSILGFFKYFNFFADSAQALLAFLGVEMAAWKLQIILPVGISFYTFQSLSYTMDVYRGHLKPSRSLLDYALYVSFFPQLVAGPIERATNLLPQVENPRKLSWDRAREASWLILWGIFKKVVIADNLATIADSVFNGDVPLNTLNVLIGVYAFAFQIYCDFSGYSDIARGLARLMGFDLMLNFRNPYFARNPSDFWRRWHISLSTWLRDYLYIPLGGNRKGPRRTYINLSLTMLLGGLWHGAAWTFVAWGAYQGALLAIHRAIVGDARRSEKASGILPVIGMFHLACIGWLLFRAQSMGQVGQMVAGLLQPAALTLGDLSPWLMFAFLCAPLWFVQYFQEKTGDMLAPMKLSILPRTALLATIFLMIWTLGNTGSRAFIYFQF
jgi:alginate O-acetyltransferase complex protein AlgI